MLELPKPEAVTPVVGVKAATGEVPGEGGCILLGAVSGRVPDEDPGLEVEPDVDGDGDEVAGAVELKAGLDSEPGLIHVMAEPAVPDVAPFTWFGMMVPSPTSGVGFNTVESTSFSMSVTASSPSIKCWTLL